MPAWNQRGPRRIAALVLGPTGLAFDRTTDTLHVASTADNEIFAIPNAGVRSTKVNRGNPVFANSHLRPPCAGLCTEWVVA
ncbi:hypothetical protein EKH80_10790 [Dyella choica]|uniref:SMP-30/Gluconolactonase/LRE-like region domain-containing protein n=1 Tax=Dyella choica TaxID=1927959 RepID=A0A3S0PLY7_9GAMM|nr:hypothetical protein EKH80_10790 [Dyella choica]